MGRVKTTVMQYKTVAMDNQVSGMIRAQSDPASSHRRSGCNGQSSQWNDTRV